MASSWRANAVTTGLRGFVPRNRLVDLLAVGVHLPPGTAHVLGSEGRVAGQELLLGPAQATSRRDGGLMGQLEHNHVPIRTRGGKGQPNG